MVLKYIKDVSLPFIQSNFIHQFLLHITCRLSHSVKVLSTSKILSTGTTPFNDRLNLIYKLNSFTLCKSMVKLVHFNLHPLSSSQLHT